MPTNAREAAVAELERNLGHAFTDRKRLDLALTHASVGGASRVTDNERFEFLGDRVLGLLAAERLMTLYPEAPEGKLTPRFHGLVDKPACAAAARGMGIGPALRLSPGETKTGGRDKDTVLADACEAVMAALYLDGGLEVARAVFLRFWDHQIEHLGAPAVETTQFEERPDGSARIEQTIYVERESQRPIILGKGGQTLKWIGQHAREELSELLDRKVHLFLHVKVNERWTEDRALYAQFGLDFDAK